MENEKKAGIDLLHGRIFPSLTGLALPIMATSLVQTAYNLTDMAWIGRVGSGAVAAVGAAGMYTWFSSGIVLTARMGGQVKVAHNLGQGDLQEARAFGRGALQLAIILALSFALLVNIFANQLIGFFGLENPATIEAARSYLRITCGLILFSFLNQTMTGLFTAIGDSKTPFAANCVGLAANMVLDPVLIFGLGPFPRMEAVGAAVATVAAQMIVTLVMIGCARREPILFSYIRPWQKTSGDHIKAMVKLGLPSALQSMLYSAISMVLTRMVAGWGDGAVAAQRVGGQAECISWMTAEGFGSAMNAFTGQNYGAKQYSRVRKSYSVAAFVIGFWGIFTSCILIFGAEPVFQIFIKEEAVLPIGISYLIILGVGQMPMCLELMTGGALQGLGKTMSCSVITVVLTAARIPLALFLSRTALGLNGIWWALTMTSIAKGIVFVGYYLWTLKRLTAEEARV